MRTFRSFGGFAAHLRRLATEAPAVTGEIAEKIGELVEKAAKDEIGHYQAAAGPFPAWAPLTAGTEARKAVLGYPSNAPLLARGDMRDSIGHTVALRMLGATVTVGSNDEKMVFHEDGTSKMPARPVLGLAMFRAKEDIEKIAAAVMLAYLMGRARQRKG